MENNKKIKYWKDFAVIALIIILLNMSISHAEIRVNNLKDGENIDTKFGNPIELTFDDPFYTWEDHFENEQLIDSAMSYDYETEESVVKIKSTYPIWTDASWTCMRPIIIENNAGKTLLNYAIHLSVQYDSDMDHYYHDIRFKHEDFETQWLAYWIEAYDTSSAEVWVNIPSLPPGQSKMYLFYGNPSASDHSDFYGVFSEWEEEWANDEKLSIHVYTEGAWDPDVAYGDDRFLIVWEEGQALYPPYTFFYKQDIRGSIYDINGNPIRQDFEIRSGQGEQWHHENPSTAYGNDKFFVVWEHYTISTDPHSRRLLGKMVTTSGSVGSQVIVCEEDDIQADPCVAYDSINDRFCVIWEDARKGTGNYDIYGKLYDINGNQIGEEKEICIASNNQFEPWVVFDHKNNQYMIVWEEKKGDFEIDIMGGLFDSNLNLIRIIHIADGNSGKRYLYPAVGFCEENERFLVTYNEGTPSKPYRGDVCGKIFDESGNLEVASEIKIKQGSFIRTDIASYLSTAFLVSFNGGGNIWGRFLSSEDGTVYNDEYQDIQLSASPSSEADWANMAVGGNEIFVVWEDARVDYAAPFDGMPDAYGNVWHLNIGGGSEVTCTFESEKQLILDAEVTSKEISFENILYWYDFDADYEGSVSFDILSGNGQIIKENVNPGVDLSGLDNSGIRLRAHLTRIDPSYTPKLDRWTVRYIGLDEEPPRTEIDFIDGIKGVHDWYIEESVTVWLHAEDFPEDTGSGIDKTYYSLNLGSPQIYNDDSGIHLSVSQSTNWMGLWEINFWSVDRSNNVEDKTQPENKITIKIDAERPYIEIIEPVNEQKVKTPFWVKVEATDNAEIDRVEFDIEPFGKRPGLPYIDETPPYEWYCDVKTKSKSNTYSLPTNSYPNDVNLMIRAQIYDESGQTWIHEIWVYITNRKSKNEFENNMCIILSQGTGTITSIQNNGINWDYSSGFCFSAGIDGIYNTKGAHSGIANRFLGIANKNIVVGIARYVFITS